MGRKKKADPVAEDQEAPVAETVIAHSLMGPSSLERRQACPGSYRLEQFTKKHDVGSEDASRGTRLHDIVARCIKGEISDEVAAKEAGDDAVPVMYCIRESKALIEKMRKHNARIVVEEKLDLSGIHDEIGFGTIDLGIAVVGNMGIVVDYKFGNRPVPPARTNLQTVTYALGLQDAYMLTEVKVVILLAEKEMFSEYTFTDGLLDDAREQIAQMVEVCKAPFAPFRPSEEACVFCSAKGPECPAYIALAAALPVESDPSQIRPEDLGAMLERAKLVKSWCGKIEKRAHAMLEGGEEIPGWGLKDGNQKRSWVEGVTIDVLREIASRLDLDASGFEASGLVHPAVVEKKWGASQKVREALEPLIVSQTGSKTLAKIKEKE